MSSKVIAALVDAAIPVLGGLYAILLGYRVVGKPPGQDPAYDARMERFGPKLKTLGPLLMVIGVVLGIAMALQ